MSMLLSARHQPMPLLKANHTPLDLADIDLFPALAGVYEAWRGASLEELARRLDPLELPPRVFPYVMLLDLSVDPIGLRIRLAGDFVRERYGRKIVGLTPHDFFTPDQADHVIETALEVADRREADLAHRSYVGIQEDLWSYTRLMLPLAGPDGTVDRIFKVIEPKSLFPT